MKPLWCNVLTNRIAVAAALVAVPCLLTASCAETNDSPAPPQNDASTLPSPDGGGDGGDSATEPPACGGTDWCIVPTGVSPLYVLKSVWGSGKNDVWAAGSGGAIAHFDGTQWSPMPSNGKETINAVWGSGPEDVYLAGSAGVFFHTTGVHGGAATFTPLAIEGADEAMGIHTIWGSSASDVRLGTDFFYLYDPDNRLMLSHYVLSQKPGKPAGWLPSGMVPVNGSTEDTFIRSIWGASADDFWVAASQLRAPGREAVTVHGKSTGGKWAFSDVDSQSSTPLESVHGTSAKDVWAVGAGGAIRHITDTDTRWQVVASPTTKTLHAVWASAPDDIWAVGEELTILHYDGKSFTRVAAESQGDRKPALWGMWGSGPNDLWIVGDAIVLHYTGPRSFGEDR